MSSAFKNFFIVYLLFLLLSNAALFMWTYPAGGYGSLAALVLAPVVNLLGLGLGCAFAYGLGKQAGSNWPQRCYNLLMASAGFCMLLMFSLILGVYGHSGC